MLIFFKRYGGDETRVEHHQLVVEDVVGHEDLQRAQHAAPRREEEGEVVDEQIFVGEKIFEHPPHRKTLLRGRDGGALFALEAEGDHEPERHDGADERHPEVGQTHRPAHEHHGEKVGDAAARRAADALDGEHLFALAEVVREHRDAAVYGRVAEGVGAVVDEICNGEPGELAHFRDVCGELLNLILSKSVPKNASLTASHIFTASMTTATFSGSMPCMTANVVRNMETRA